MFSKRIKNIRVEYSETRTVNFQSRKAGIAFDLPEGMTLSQGRNLAQFLCRWQTEGSALMSEVQKYKADYFVAFDEDIEKFGSEIVMDEKMISKKTNVRTRNLPNYDDFKLDGEGHPYKDA